jgi:site-specific recombinase XerD
MPSLRQVFRRGNSMGGRSLMDRDWSLIRASAGLEGVRYHDLRHSFASLLVGEGLSLPIIGKMLGHSKPQTTARYAHLADQPLREAAEIVAGKIGRRPR